MNIGLNKIALKLLKRWCSASSGRAVICIYADFDNDTMGCEALVQGKMGNLVSMTAGGALHEPSLRNILDSAVESVKAMEKGDDSDPILRKFGIDG